MTKSRDSSQLIRAGEATCPWDLNRMTQLISRAGSLGFKPPGGLGGGGGGALALLWWVPGVIESMQAEGRCSELLVT
jgi:hypothetical protein